MCLGRLARCMKQALAASGGRSAEGLETLCKEVCGLEAICVLHRDYQSSAAERIANLERMYYEDGERIRKDREDTHK